MVISTFRVVRTWMGLIPSVGSPCLMPRTPMVRRTMPATYMVALPIVPSMASPNSIPAATRAPPIAANPAAIVNHRAIEPGQPEDQHSGEDIERQRQRQQKPGDRVHTICSG
jgi:hypothetical protein